MGIGMTPIRTFYLPTGRVIVSKTDDGHYIESTEMRDVSVDGKDHAEVRETLDPRVIWRHLAPIENKWLATVSTQVGCPFGCKFCDVGELKFRRNLTSDEIMWQVKMLVDSTPELQNGTNKAKIGFARMGEPMCNLSNVLKVMTSLPSNIKWLPCFNSIVPKRVTTDGNPFTGLEGLEHVLALKENELDGFVHVQISVNSTDEASRKGLFGGADVVPLSEVINLVKRMPIRNRTVTLNFISMKGVELDAKKLETMGITPDKFSVKVIPLNRTFNSERNILESEYDYTNYEELKAFEARLRGMGIPIVTDATGKCEQAGLCCGQLLREYYEKLI
jgi:23S rRNA (adenine2503-C2)-methyltransferase